MEIGCGAIIALLIVVSLIATYPEVAVAILVIGLIIGGIALVVKAAEKKELEAAAAAAAEEERRRKEEERRRKEEETRRRNLAIVNAPEIKPALIPIPESADFKNKEEQDVNQQWFAYLQGVNAVTEAKAHLDYLTKKKAALVALQRNEEAAQLTRDIELAHNALAQAQTKKKALTSKMNGLVYRDATIKKAFSAFADRLECTKPNTIGDFLQSPMLKVVRVSNSVSLIFTPAYVMCFSPNTNRFEIHPYSEVSVTSRVYTELIHGYTKPGDEVQRVSYLYETKDGRRDMRYTYANNPSYTYVYRGTVTISCGKISYEQKFTNKSLTESFAAAVKAYLTLMTKTYPLLVKSVLSHDAELTEAGSVTTFMESKAAADKKRLAAEKAAAEKKEEQRRKRQEAAEAIRRTAQKKVELLKSLTIENGVLTNWHGSDKHLVLPSDTMQVIGTAFRWKPFLERVDIPEGITTIYGSAFHGSTKLQHVEIGSTVREIGTEAFAGCSALTYVKLPSALKELSARLFLNCSSLEALHIPVGVTKIGAGAFKGCLSLKRLYLPEGLVSIEDGAFDGCVALTEIVIPASVTKLGQGVFAGCVALERVTLGCGITVIPDGCFSNLQKLAEVSVSSNLSEIGPSAFKGCLKLASFRRMDSAAEGAATQESRRGGLVTIGASAFENCFALTGVDLSDGLTTIGDYAFANCRSLAAVALPPSLQSFGKGVFAGCVALASVTGAEQVDWHKKHAFAGAPWLATQAADGFVMHESYLEAYVGQAAEVEIPAHIEVIGRCAFDGNAAVSRVVIPSGVQTIEENAFANCKALTAVEIPDSVTHIEDNAFANSPSVVIHCTRGSAASAFRIRNKIAGEYIAKTQPSGGAERPRATERKRVSSGLSDLSEEELRVIMQMRREKQAQRKAEQEAADVPVTVEYVLTDFRADTVSLSLMGDFKKITNNIFNLKYVQNESVSADKQAAEYESFVIDGEGQMISNVITILADKQGEDLVHRVTYSLASGGQFNKEETYFVVLRYKGDDTSIVMKHPCQIVIEFASDFDF